MATTVEKYVAKCQEVRDAQPAYKLGASSLTECDCIGMDKYAFRECKVSFNTSGTNYSVRKQVDNFRKLIGTGDLHIGDVVFKARDTSDAYYSLPARYKPGGADYNGDLLDYYHIGTVASVYPLRIIHMTSPTARTDTSIGKWGYVGNWKPQYISGDSPAPDPDPEPTPEPTPEPSTATPAVTTSPKGTPVNLRERPSLNAPLVDQVPVGQAVDVYDSDGEWSKVTWKKKSGYMMTKFLDFSDDAKPTLRRGDRGAYVEELQTDLLTLGYDIGTTYSDGIYGKGTEAAVKAFQKAHGLIVDGVVGPMTWDALDNAEPGKKYTVTIPNLEYNRAVALKNEYAGAEMTEERG